MTDLTLFIKTGCPYCHKVLQFMDESGIALPTKNISESSEVRDELVNSGGKQQVPCLLVDGKPMYESDDIIEWLRNEFNIV